MNHVNLSHRNKLIIFTVFAAITLSLASFAIGLYIDHYHKGKVVRKIEVIKSIQANTSSIAESKTPEEMIVNLYSEYTKDKSNKAAQNSLVDTFASDSFNKMYDQKPSSKPDPLVCDNQYPISTDVTGQYQDVDTKEKVYIMKLNYANAEYNTAFVKLATDQTGHQVIKSVNCFQATDLHSDKNQ